MIKEALILLPLIATPALGVSDDGGRASLTATSPAVPGGGAVRVQPTAREFSRPNRPDVSPNSAKDIDRLYRELTGKPPAAAPPNQR
jgi:hypothetical protein